MDAADGRFDDLLVKHTAPMWRSCIGLVLVFVGLDALQLTTVTAKTPASHRTTYASHIKYKKYTPTDWKSKWPHYGRLAEWPEAAGTPLPKFYVEPHMEAPYTSLPKNISNLHCQYLRDSNIRWIVFLGDSVARAAGVAMMEHLQGDDVHFCDAANGPPEVCCNCS